MTPARPIAVSQKFSAVAQPGVMISNAWPDSRQEHGATRRAIQGVLDAFPFFEAFQTVDIPFADERREVRQLVHDAGRPHTYTLTRVLAENRLNLSALDADVRRRSCEMVVRKLDEALEAGASTVGLISGSRPAEPAQRTEALRVLEDSLATIAGAAAAHDGLDILVEPLDYEAHKRCTLGTAAEAVALCDRLAAANVHVKLCLDVAHMILNREDMLAAVGLARAHLLEFHFCNAVTDTAHPLFGDHHLPFGPPGVVDIDEIARLMAGLARGEFLDAERRPRVFCEVWKPKDTDSLAVVAHCQEALQEGWRRARRALAP